MNFDVLDRKPREKCQGRLTLLPRTREFFPSQEHRTTVQHSSLHSVQKSLQMSAFTYVPLTTKLMHRYIKYCYLATLLPYNAHLHVASSHRHEQSTARSSLAQNPRLNRSEHSKLTSGCLENYLGRISPRLHLPR